MQRTLLIMRHGKSRWDEGDIPDKERGLAKRGKRDARRMGEELRMRRLIPDFIVSSPAKRARGTARRVAQKAGYLGKVVLDERLYMGDLESHLAVLRELPDRAKTVLLVGHNPALEHLVSFFAQRLLPMPTAALACFVLQLDSWAWIGENAKVELQAHLLPKELFKS